MKEAPRRFDTDELAAGIARTKDFKRYMQSHANSFEEVSLSEALAALLISKNVKRAEVIQRADIDRAFGYQIFDGTKSPSRDKLLQLAIGFALSCKETDELLRTAGKSSLYARIKRDAVIIYCLSHALSIQETQYMLTDAGLTPLGQEKDK